MDQNSVGFAGDSGTTPKAVETIPTAAVATPVSMQTANVCTFRLQKKVKKKNIHIL